MVHLDLKINSEIDFVMVKLLQMQITENYSSYLSLVFVIMHACMTNCILVCMFLIALAVHKIDSATVSLILSIVENYKFLHL